MSEKIKLSKQEATKVKDSIQSLGKRIRSTNCRKCGDPVTIKVNQNAPAEILDHGTETPHWQTCTHKIYSQRREALDIATKLAVLFVVKFGTDFEKLANLTPRQVKIVHAIVEKQFKESSETPEQPSVDEVATTDEEGLSFSPPRTDTIGDPDEERAPDESLIGSVVEAQRWPEGTKHHAEAEERLSQVASEVADGSNV